MGQYYASAKVFMNTFSTHFNFFKQLSDMSITAGILSLFRWTENIII